MTIDHILTLLLIIPAIGLVPVYVFRSDPRAVKQVAIVTTLVELALSLVMLSQFKVGEADFQLIEKAEWLPTLGIKYFVGDDGISVPLERYAAALDERVALVATSHVFFTSGYIQPITEIARLAHAVGAHVLIDGYQAAGQIPVDVVRDDVDFYLSGGLKWLLGGPGIAELYVRPELIGQLEPTLAGWFGHRDQFAFDAEHFVFHEDARRFEIGTPAMAAVYAARAGLELVLEIGPPAIRARTQALVADLVARLRAIGAGLKLPANAGDHAGIIMVRANDPAPIVRALRDRRIIVDYRPGFVRISPYFYNTEEDNMAIAAALRELLPA